MTIWPNYSSNLPTLARLPNNPKILDLAFFSNGILGGRLKVKNILQIQVFIKVSCLKGFLLDLAFKF
jgi:hypothetical protein